MSNSNYNKQPEDCGFIFLTEACNLRCQHCYVDAAPGCGSNMPMNVFSSVLNFFKGLHIDDIRITGGEPTIHPKFDQIVDRIHNEGLKVGLVSNGIGWLGNPSRSAFLDDVSRCWVSVYGVSPHKHSMLSGRPRKTFFETLKFVGLHSRIGRSIGLSAILTPGCYEEVPDLVSLAHESGIKRLRFLPIQPDGRATSINYDWLNWPKEVRKIERALSAHPLGQHFDALTINDPFDLRSRFEYSQDSCLFSRRRMWSITPDGSIYSCCFNVYSDNAFVGNVIDANIVNKVKEASSTLSAAKTCRGLQISFWKNPNLTTATCPISSISTKA